jgi:hypothetical protein
VSGRLADPRHAAAERSLSSPAHLLLPSPALWPLRGHWGDCPGIETVLERFLAAATADSGL